MYNNSKANMFLLRKNTLGIGLHYCYCVIKTGSNKGSEN